MATNYTLLRNTLDTAIQSNKNNNTNKRSANHLMTQDHRRNHKASAYRLVSPTSREDSMKNGILYVINDANPTMVHPYGFSKKQLII